MTGLEKLHSMVPPFVGEDPIMHSFYAAVAPELENAGVAVADLPKQLWPHLATWGIARLEKVFGLSVDPSQPLESRRSALVAKLRGFGTSTLAQIKAIAESLSTLGMMARWVAFRVPLLHPLPSLKLLWEIPCRLRTSTSPLGPSPLLPQRLRTEGPLSGLILGLT